MTKIIMHVDGVNETIKNIGTFDVRKQGGARDIVEKHAKLIQNMAKKTAPRSPTGRKKSSGKPGDLRRSIRTKYYHEKLGAMIVPEKKIGPHRGIIEEGTIDRTRTKRGRTGRITAKPFMQPAKQAQIGSYNSEMQRLWDGKPTTI